VRSDDLSTPTPFKMIVGFRLVPDRRWTPKEVDEVNRELKGRGSSLRFKWYSPEIVDFDSHFPSSGEEWNLLYEVLTKVLPRPKK